MKISGCAGFSESHSPAGALRVAGIPSIFQNRENAIRFCLFRLHSFGDTLLITPVIAALKKKYPKSFLCVVSEPASAQVLKNNPNVDEIIFYQKGWRALSVLWRLRKYSFDCAIDFLGNLRSIIVALASGATMRIGFCGTATRWAYTHVVPPHVFNYVGRQNLDLLGPLGISSAEILPEIFPAGEEKTAALNFFEKNGLVPGRPIGLFPTASWRTKSWPDNHYIELGRLIASRTGRKILVFWGPAEKDSAAQIAAGIGPQALCIPESSFLLAAAFFQLCKAAVGNDSAFTHLTIAARTPSLSIFGPTEEKNWVPSGDPYFRSVRKEDLSCKVCHKTHCTTMRCMKELSPQKVYEAFEDLMAFLERQ